jgi:hypothetical protein
MSKPKPDFSMAQLIEELRGKVPTVDDDGARTEEICLALGLGETTVRKMLRQLKAQGRLEVVRRRIEAVDGKLVTVRAYRIPAQGGTDGTASRSG